MQHANLSLDDRYAKQSGIVFLSGIHALVRALMEQHRLDTERGLQTAGFVSGYRGSPLAGLDKALWDQQPRLDALNLHFQPGVNEELAATAVWGSQQSNLFAGAKHDGVFGLWYGKAPGLDRASDAIRHANFAGTSPHGGVLLVVGDDHGCKSSTLPSHSELALKDLGIPVLNPADVQEVLDLSLFGWALSRYAGCWSGLVALADTMDSSATVALPHPDFVVPPHGYDVHIRLNDQPLDQEQRLYDVKLALAVKFARANGVNRTIGATGKTQLGIVTTGRAYLDVRQALFELGFQDEHSLTDAGIKILRLGMSWPLDRRLVQDFTRDVPRVLVVEEKRSFIEAELKELLYNTANAPRIMGKRDEQGRSLFPGHGEIDVATIAQALATYVNAVPNISYLDSIARREAALRDVTARAKTERTPLFCAGCPHNMSTRVPEGSRASAGIGCHYMAQWMDRETHTFTQMGGEGANWVGQAPFTDEQHIFVNLGDGTYFHSGLLAIRQAVAAGVNVTYKILFNDAVAMTGGQPTDGSLTVADVVAQLKAEGVGLVSVVSDAPLAHRALDVPVHHRDQLDEVQRRHRDVIGCSAIIYQQACATELRRKRKRGLIEDPDVRVMINDAVCEGCGDCSVQSNCVAVEPIETEFGVKRSINQTACNKDLSCLKGFCPAFVIVKGGQLRTQTGVDMCLDEVRGLAPLPTPVGATDADEPATILVTGVGGTGIVTVSALLGMAAHIDGKAVSTLDMTGLAQKGGAVMSHVQIANDRTALHATRLANGKAQLMLTCDMVTGASQEALALLQEDAIAIVNTAVAPTADFVLHQQSDVQLHQRLQRIAFFSGHVEKVDADRLTRLLLGDTAQTNVFLLGFGYQQGTIPLSIGAIERAIELNGVAVEKNLQAFHFGRLAAHDASRLPEVTRRPATSVMDPKRAKDLATTIAERSALLVRYHDDRLAARYRKLVDRVAEREQQAKVGSEQLTRAVAETYPKLLAVKDEYEVARLYTDGRWQAKLASQFEGDFTVSYLLAPPLLGSKKRWFGAWMGIGFKLLAKLKPLRGTWLDPFAYTRDRRQDQWLLRHFEELVDTLLAGLDGQNLDIAARVARLGLEAKGYGHVKARAIAELLDAERSLLEEFHRSPSPVTLFDPKLGRHAA